MYGFNAAEFVPFRSASGGGRTVYYTDDQSINLDDVININNQNVKIPNDIVIKGILFIIIIIHNLSIKHLFSFISQSTLVSN